MLRLADECELAGFPVRVRIYVGSDELGWAEVQPVPEPEKETAP